MSDLQAPEAASDDQPQPRSGPGTVVRAPITVYKARRPRRRRPLWVRLLLWTFLALFLCGGAAAGGVVYFKVYAPLQNITSLGGKNDVADLKGAQADPKLAGPPPAGAPATALVIGYDHRVTDGKGAPSRSDTLMLVHVDPKRKTMTLLSIPRDTKALIPGHGYDKINAAYSLGKARLALDTVTNLLPGVRINYIIAVNFHGFTQTVDAFGGVYLDVDRRYYNKNIGTLDTDYANIDLPPGYQLLRGADALSYVRFRHNDSDIYRTVRQQEFVREFKKRLDGHTKNVGRILDLIDILSKNVKVAGSKGHQPGPTTMERYLTLLSDIPRSRMLQVHLDGPWDGTYVDVAPSTIQTAVQQFMNPDIAAANTVANRDVGGTVLGPKTHKRKGLPVIPAARLRVATLNGSAVDGQANQAVQDLRAAGYKHAALGDLPGPADKGISGNAWRQNFPYSMVYYSNQAAKGAAIRLVRQLVDAEPAAFPPQLKPLAGQYDVVIATGKTFDGVHAVNTPTVAVPPREKPTVQAVPASTIGTWRQIARGVHYPILAPTVVPSGTVFAEPVERSYQDPRVYTLIGHKAAHLTAYANYTDPKSTWGIQWTRWPTAPILDQPTQTRVVKGKSGKHRWQLYFNGGNIHRIAIFYGKNDRYAMWVDNSLTDGFSNATMIAVAKGLRPVAP